MELDSVIIEDARIAMYARILRCPLGDNPEDCPLYEVRKWPVERRLAWLNSTTDEEVVELFNRHCECLEFKLTELSS